jgi:hypothetical protein
VTSAAICFAPSDSAPAQDLARYLQLHTALRFDLADSKGPGDFLDVVEQCLVQEFVIVLLSAKSVPSPWPRSLWEPVLLGAARESNTQLAYVMLGNCSFPTIMRRRNFFDLTQDANAGWRALRRWLIQRLDPERSGPALAMAEDRDESLLWLLDEPGLSRNVAPAAAAWMTRHHWPDFEGVYWIQCAHRTPAGVLGELAHEMGLRLPGTVESNWRHVRQRAAEYRALYIFQNLLEYDVPDLGGKASILLLEAHQPHERITFPELQRLFSAAALDEKACLQGWSELVTAPDEIGPWPEVRSIAWLALRILKAQARLAEAHESLEWLAHQARKQADHRALELIRWEEDWILDAWDLAPRDRAELTRAQPHQLWLPLPNAPISA